MQRITITYGATISACEKGGQWQQTLELFGRMLGEGVQRDIITYSAAIGACEDRRAGIGSRLRTSSKECWVLVCSEILSPIVLLSVRARRADNGSRNRYFNLFLNAFQAVFKEPSSP